AARDGRPMSFEDDADATQAYPMMAPPMTGQTPYASDAEAAPETGPMSTIMAKQEERPPQKRSRAWIWIGRIFVLLALAAVALWVYEINKPEPIVQVEVTDVAGMDADAAEDALIQLGLSVDTDQKYRAEGEQGRAADTEPPGREVGAASNVKAIVRSGPGSVEVPGVAGETGGGAGEIHNGAKLQAGTHVSQDLPDVEKGVVIETKPGDGQEVDVDSNVDLVVSSGMVEVPDVTGKSADEACKILEGDDYQLKCKTEEVETDDEDEKKVFEQSATGGTEVKQGTEITVKVAKKPSEPSPTMPSVPGG